MGAITTEEMEQSINRLLSLSSFAIVPRVIAGLGYHEEQSYNFVKVIDHECDLLCITNSGYLTEIEIKISVSDLRADFKKKKKGHGGDFIRNFYYAVPEYMLEKTLELIPENTGVIVVRVLNEHFKTLQAEIYRKPKPNRQAKKLPVQAKVNLLRLGCLKYWNKI